MDTAVFFFNDTATTEIYTLSLHDALPISFHCGRSVVDAHILKLFAPLRISRRDRKSTRLNSSHLVISYAVFCLKKKRSTRWTIQDWKVSAAPNRPTTRSVSSSRTSFTPTH